MTLNDLLVFDPTLFSEYVIDERLSREILTSSIMMRCGLMTPLYLEPDVFKSMVNTWFYVHKDNFAKLIDTTLYDYNPIENYDRYEKSLRNEEGNEEGEGNTEATTENKVSAYNKSNYQDDNMSESNGKSTTKNKRINSDKYESRVHGNIGVTTTQQMIEQERNIVVFNVIDYIVTEFKKELMIGVYS